jgi:ribosomal protein S19
VFLPKHILQVAVCKGTPTCVLLFGVRSAGPVFVNVIVHVQVVGHSFTAFVITQHGHVWRMVKLEKFHA